MKFISMPSLVETENMTDCLHRTERSDHLPQITGISNLRNVSKNEDHETESPRNNEHLISDTKYDTTKNNNNGIKRSMIGYIKHESRTITSFGSTGSSVHFKLPVIDLTKGYKISGGITSKQDHQKNLKLGKDRSLARSLNYQSNAEEIKSIQNQHEPAISNSEDVSEDVPEDVTSKHRQTGSHITSCDDRHVSILPNILHKGDLSNSSPVHASFKSNNAASNSLGSSRLPFKRESSITSISAQGLSLVGRKSTLCHRNDVNVLQKSRTHVSPLLLPMSIHKDPSAFIRKQHKGKQTVDK